MGMLWRVIRGMIPHKTARGAAALDRLTLHDGCPHPYDMKKKMVVPQALKILKIRPYRKFCVLGDLAVKAGWKNKDLLSRLEAKRRTRSAAFFKRKMAVIKTKSVAAKKVSLSADEKAVLAKAGC